MLSWLLMSCCFLPAIVRSEGRRVMRWVVEEVPVLVLAELGHAC
jgi:hypothetical protein